MGVFTKTALWPVLFSLFWSCSYFEKGQISKTKGKENRSSPLAKENPAPPPESAKFEKEKKEKQQQLSQFCLSELSRFPGKSLPEKLQKACASVRKLPGCESVKGRPIFHMDNSKQAGGERILVLGAIHGDEPESGSVARAWMERLTELESRSHWRILPMVNPDGVDRRTRMNQRGVDLNRNFPTKDWEYSALNYWRQKKKADPRRFPGPTAASEPETKCVIEHIKDFRPTFIISLHTPYGVLDFDGPQLDFPPFKGLPWSRLGHFPGSLGRYMWYDKGTPVLTVELTGKVNLNNTESLYNLQDLSGLVAIKSVRFLQRSSFAQRSNSSE